MKTTTLFIGLLFIAVSGSAQLQQCDELFISEYVEGSGKNRVIEVYNPTDASVDLSNYSIKIFTAGPNNPNVLQLMGFLPSQEVHVCGHPQADPTGILPKCDATSNEIKFDGNDAVGLYKNDTLIDVIGVIGVDPGNTGWMVGTGFTKNNTLVRGWNVTAPSPYWNVNVLTWDVFAIDDTFHLGEHVSACPLGVFQFALSGSTSNEIDGTHSIEVTTDGNNTQPVQILVSEIEIWCANSTTADANDYTNFTGNLLFFGAGQNSSENISLGITNDAIPESTEYVCFGITVASGDGTVPNFEVHQWTIIDDEPQGIGDADSYKHISIMPNPVSEMLTIKGINEVEINQITITNLLGQKMQAFSQFSNEVNVGELNEGIYFLNLYTDNTIITRKFVKE